MERPGPRAAGRVRGIVMAGLLFAASGAAAGDDAAGAQQARLAEHSFVRTKCDATAAGLILGNTELGGPATASGLSIPRLWGSDLWVNDHARVAVQGPALECAEFADTSKVSEYRQELNLADAVLKTRAMYGAGNGYEAELFCSMANRHLVVLRVKNLGGTGGRTWFIGRPTVNCSVTNPAPGLLTGRPQQQGFTRHAWALSSSKAMEKDPGGREIVRLAPDETVTLTFSLTTHWDGDDYARSCEKAAAADGAGYAQLSAAHRDAWSALWRQSAVLAIPDAALERLWYRSLFQTLCMCGSERFLPGESMFAIDCWEMHPFTYGAAGWAVQAFTSAGFPGLARTMLNWHFKPEAMRQNAQFYATTLAGRPAGADAMAFAHEVNFEGRRVPCGHWELQRHLDGFGASMFYRVDRLYPDPAFQRDVVYPVLRGVAEFWRALAMTNGTSGEFVLPRMTSLTEDLVEKNVIDAALAAQWCLMQADRMASERRVDPELRKSWKDLADRLCIPQKAERYLEYYGDEEKRAGGGYQGVRGFVYLGYPTMELIQRGDRDKAVRTLDYTWVRNRQGDGMIGFVANWFALADTHYGRSEHALSVMRHNLKCVDASDASLSETPGSGNRYFTTCYSSYVPVPVSMAVQSFDDRIAVFPAVPADWKDFAFYNVPAEDGIRVSGQMKDGRVLWTSYCRDGKELLRLDRKAVVAIRREGTAVRLVVEPDVAAKRDEKP